MSTTTQPTDRLTPDEAARSLAAVQVIKAVADAIRDLGRVPSGHLYAGVMGRMTLEQYEAVIGILIGAGLVERKSHELIWLGPSARAE